MASRGPTGTGADAIHVRVVGSGDVANSLPEPLIPAVDGSTAEAVEALKTGTDVDCVLAVLPLPDGDLPELVEDIRSVVDVPVVAVVEDPATANPVEADVDDIVTPADDLLARLAWLVTPADNAPGAPATDVEAPTFQSLTGFGDACFELDRRWRFRSVNDRAADLLGRPAEELVGERLWTTFPGLLDTSFHRGLGDCVRGGGAVTFEARLPHADLWVEATVRSTEVGILTRLLNVTERVEERRTRERYEHILETIDDGIYTLDGNFVITHVNAAVEELTGYARDKLIGAHSTLLADEEVILRASEAIQEILAGERESGLLEAELERADGSTFPIETHFSALQFEDGSHGSVGVVRDITERKEYERTLTELNRSTNELFRAETKPEVAQLVVDTAADVLGLPTVAVYLFEEADGSLQPTAWHAGDVPTPIGPGDGAVWRGFLEGEPVALDSSDVADWTGAPDTIGTALPLGEHGVLVVASSNDSGEEGMTARRRENLARLLETSTEAAFDRVDRRLELKRRERELALRAEDLQHTNQINELLRDINRSLVEAETRGAIERSVCERLSSASSVEFAWLGEYDRTAGRVEPVVRSGQEQGYLDTLPTGGGHDDDEPSVRAARTGEAAVVGNVAQDIQRRSWRQRALSRGFRSVVSVPLVYRDYVYGVLTLYAGRASAFDEETVSLFAELGRTTAYAISGVEAKESLHTESVVELDLLIPANSALFSRMARTLGAEITLEGAIQRSDGGSRLYLTVTEPVEPVEAIASLGSVERVQRVAEAEGEVLIEVMVDERVLPAQFGDLGAANRSLTATPESIRAVVELQTGADVRGFVEAIAETYPGTELAKRQTRERPIETRRAFLATVEESLTDRQLEVLRTAFHSGYFQWPRSRSGEETAASLGIAQSTFNRHLRVAERKLLSRLFEAS